MVPAVTVQATVSLQLLAQRTNTYTPYGAADDPYADGDVPKLASAVDEDENGAL